MEQWPFVDGDATLAEAIAFIARLTAREGESFDAGKRRVRDHVRKAVGRKRKTRFDAPRDTSARVGQPFWAWASNEWPALKAVQGFPYAPTNFAIIRSILRLECSGTVTAVPNNVPDLQKAYSEQRAEAQRLSARNDSLSNENAGLKAKLQSAEDELAIARHHAAETKRRRSEAGKRGKGIKHRR